jgi:hypothetical protein
MCVSIGCVVGPESEQEPQPTPHNTRAALVTAQVVCNVDYQTKWHLP